MALVCLFELDFVGHTTTFLSVDVDPRAGGDHNGIGRHAIVLHQRASDVLDETALLIDGK